MLMEEIIRAYKWDGGNERLQDVNDFVNVFVNEAHHLVLSPSTEQLNGTLKNV